MTYIKKIALGAFLSLAMLSNQGCKNYFDDLAENPNLVQNPPVNSFLSTTTFKAGVNSYRIANFTSYYTQYLASPTAGGVSDTYQISDNSVAWNNVYYALADITDFKAAAQNIEATTHLGVANTLMVYHLALINDVWGAAPYSDAFALTGTLLPSYDGDESLYNTCLTLIDEAIAQLSEDSDVALDAGQDLIHGGSRTAWLRTANALKARLLNKVSKKAIYNPTAVLEAIEQSYLSNSDDAGMAVFNGNNPWAQIAISNANALLGGWLSDNLINQLNGTTYGIIDPRLYQITDETVNGDYVGTRNGRGNVGAANTIHDECYISVNSPLTSVTAPLTLVSFAEVRFIEAEAALRSGNAARAYEAYLAGIRAHMEKLEVPTADADAYINSSVVSVGAGALTLDLIFKEKYIVTYLNPEAWNDARRHDYNYQGWQLPFNAVLDEGIRQVAYPQDEIARNGSNVPLQNSLADRLWFDQP